MWRRTLALAVLLLAGANAQKIATGSLPDISGSGSKAQLASSGAARWVTISAPSGNASGARCCDTNITSSRGLIIAPGGVMNMEVLPVPAGGNPADSLYQFSTIYVLVQSGDTLNVIYGN